MIVKLRRIAFNSLVETWIPNV